MYRGWRPTALLGAFDGRDADQHVHAQASEIFQYYGMMSAGLPAPSYDTLTPPQIAALQGKSIWIGGGWQDAIHAAGFKTTATSHIGPAREVSTFAKAGIPVTRTSCTVATNVRLADPVEGLPDTHRLPAEPYRAW